MEVVTAALFVPDGVISLESVTGVRGAECLSTLHACIPH